IERRHGEVRLWQPDSEKEPTILRRHLEPVQALDWREDGQTLASGSADRTIRLWDPVAGQERASIQAHSAAPPMVAFLPGSGLVSLGADGVLKIWDGSPVR